MSTLEMTRNAPAPERSLRQRLEALENANRIRTFRSRLKRDVRTGREDALQHLRRPSGDIASMKVFDLLLAMPGRGRVKVNRALVQCRISPSKTIGGMTERQRLELARAIGGWRA